MRKRDSTKTADTKAVRCAIYTRKSTEEGLEQAFNSLDAQRESGEACVAAQKHEGWICLPTRYDDGGFSGGNIERPALKRLLSDIDAGKIDCVVVYKVDRLSRSLMDFSRVMQTFEKHGVSFVSVTETGKSFAGDVLRLSNVEPGRNVNLRIGDISRSMWSHVPPQFADLVEIAAYVYVADQAHTRGGDGCDDMGAQWRRPLHFEIPVRCPDLWGSAEITGALVETLCFLSDDTFSFAFRRYVDPPRQESFLMMANHEFMGQPERVVLFSGGLDSLGGVVQERVIDRRPVLMVTHRSTHKLVNRLKTLLTLLDQRAGLQINRPVTVEINKAESLSREYTQRTRSFLYASLGVTIARMCGLDDVRFYENGTVSLNLPISRQVVGAKATRTTHPRVIKGFAKLFSLLANRPVSVTNGFLWKTKGEVVDLIVKAGCGNLIEWSTSCTHTWEITNAKPHCGKCSQCIDRRFAVLAAGAGVFERGDTYGVDLITDPRDEGEPRTMLASYVEVAQQVVGMNEAEFFTRFGEAARVFKYLDGSASENARRIHDLYRRHGQEVVRVVDAGLAEHVGKVRARKLPESCLLRLVHDPGISNGAAVCVTTPPEPAHEEPDYFLRQRGHPRCVERADEFLPPTPAEFGRPGKPRSHRLYRATIPCATRKFRSKSAGMLVEFRSTGCQTVLPHSTHVSGEKIVWVMDGAEPGSIDPDELLTAIARLADAVKVELGEKTAPKTKPIPKTKLAAEAAAPAAKQPSSGPEESDPVRQCLATMLMMRIVDHNDGSLRLYAAACRAVEHDLNDADALTTVRSYERERPFPRQWTDDDVLARLRDAERECVRGVAFQDAERDGQLALLGQRDPATGRLVLSSKRTLPTAAAYLQDFHQHPDGRTLHSYAGALFAWSENRYADVEDGAVRQRLLPWLHDALRYVYNRKTDSVVLGDFDSNPATVTAALDSIRAYAHLPITVTPPAWLRPGALLPDPKELLPCRSATLHVPTGRLLPATPNFFNVAALDFDYDPDAEPCERWTAFLEQLWGDDLESVALLQEWIGYCLVADTSQQKMLLVVGPRRGGKGTIGRVLRSLVGVGNVAGPTTGSLAGAFGLQPLIGKSLAIVSDARFSGDNVSTVIERLLCISGEDTLTVDRKFLGGVTMRLPTRFMFLTNELPRLNDASGALAGRFVILRLTRSFYGQEDTGLEAKLMAELPGILLWAIEGLRRLRKRGHFAQPTSVEDAVREMEDLASPVGAFVRERCDLGPGRRVWVDDLYAAWKQWCDQDGRTTCSTKQTFGRDLVAAVPGIACRRNQGYGRFYEGIGLNPQGGVA